jgi:TonB family protein
LDDALRANYPALARAQGLPGHAVVRARILADGRVSDTRVLLASAPEFGRACQRTVTGSRWSAPLDKSGQPVTTEVSYQCQFEVSQ